jgi:hypothetical protein
MTTVAPGGITFAFALIGNVSMVIDVTDMPAGTVTAAGTFATVGLSLMRLT